MESVSPTNELSRTSGKDPAGTPSSHKSHSSAKFRKNSRESMSAATEDDVSFDDGHPGTFDSEGVEQEKTIVESPSVNDKSKTSVNKEVANAVVNGINEEPHENKDANKENTVDNEEEEGKDTKSSKKRGRKLKKISEKRTAFDGRKVVFVTEFTQTDWKWKDKTEKSGRGTLVSPSADKVMTPSSRTTDQKSSLDGAQTSKQIARFKERKKSKHHLAKSDSRQSFGQAYSENESRQEFKTVTDLTPFSFEPDDEFGLPILDISSDSDSSGEEVYKVPKHYKHHLPSVGPPLILRYIRESEKLENQREKVNRDLSEDDLKLKSADQLPEEQIDAGGMFSGSCEFCGMDIKPFPTLDQQLSEPPESLYCCEEYRDFVEFAITTATKMEEDMKSREINVKVHDHCGSKRERRLAKEKAVQRMYEREQQRRLQEVREMQSVFNQSSTTGEVSISTRETKDSQSDESSVVNDMDSRSPKDIRSDVEAVDHSEGNLKQAVDQSNGNPKQTIYQSNGNPKQAVDQSDDKKKQIGSDEKGTEKLGNKERKLEITRENEEVRSVVSKKDTGKMMTRGRDRRGKFGGASLARGMTINSEERGIHTGGGGGGQRGRGGRLVTHHFSLGMAQGGGIPYSPHGSLNIEVARQMKTINYQLSSQRCLEEGWTLRAPSPMESDDLESEIFVSEPLNPVMVAAGKLPDRPLIEKYYPDKTKFLTIFPDGTGNVFYPSGRIAILISSVVLGQYTYIVLDDNEHGVLGLFEPNGYGCCCFSNGRIRLTYDPTGGLELDYAGGRRRAWNWKDQETHVHAPPFQPIVFGMNQYLGIRFMTQESLALTLTGRKRSCRFNVGAKLKLVMPENIQTKSTDENQLLIKEHRVRVETILSKIANLLKFPKSPKVDRILPPLSVSVRKQKVEKMKQESAKLSQTQQTGRKPQKVVKQMRLPPLDSSAVSVS